MRGLSRIALALALMSSAARADDETTARPCDALRCIDIELAVVTPCGHNSANGVTNDQDDRAAPRCPPLRDREWFAGQLRHANKLFAPLQTGFRTTTRRVVTGPARVRTRRQRDELGRHPRRSTAIAVFLVDELVDVDIKDHLLRGVHWRRRDDRTQTWIILSGLDDTGAVLAHELGHYFGLPHSKVRQSVMNKAPHEDPAFVDRVFVPAEIDALRAGLRARFPDAATGSN